MVTKAKIDIAKRQGLQNVDILAAVTDQIKGFPFCAATALMTKESGGRNVFGHDAGGALSGGGDVTYAKWQEFRHLVVDLGHTSNGVGPCQITWRGFFTAMEHQGLKPYDVHDNMLYGCRLIWGYYNTNGKSWVRAGASYNGALIYGQDYQAQLLRWHKLLNP